MGRSKLHNRYATPVPRNVFSLYDFYEDEYWDGADGWVDWHDTVLMISQDEDGDYQVHVTDGYEIYHPVALHDGYDITDVLRSEYEDFEVYDSVRPKLTSDFPEFFI